MKIKRKILFSILLCLLLVLTNVKALDKDYTVIEEFHARIAPLSVNQYSLENRYTTFTKFGDQPSEHYFYQLIKRDYYYMYKNKTNKIGVDFEILNIKFEKGYGVLDHEKGSMINFGDPDKLLNEKEIINISYEVNFDKQQDNIYSYVISDNQYLTKKTTFEIILPRELKEVDIMFSLDNKKYEKKIEGLTYKIVEGISIKGEYLKELNINETLSFMVVYNSGNDYKKNIPLEILLIIFAIIFVLIFLKVKAKN